MVGVLVFVKRCFNSLHSMTFLWYAFWKIPKICCVCSGFVAELTGDWWHSWGATFTLILWLSRCFLWIYWLLFFNKQKYVYAWCKILPTTVRMAEACEIMWKVQTWNAWVWGVSESAWQALMPFDGVKKWLSKVRRLRLCEVAIRLSMSSFKEPQLAVSPLY